MRRDTAIYTMVHSDELFVPQWVAYYERYFAAEDIYIIAQDLYGECEVFVREGSRQGRFNVLPMHQNWIHNQPWYVKAVQNFQYILFMSYRKVMFAEIDEFVVTRPGSKWTDIGEYFGALDAPAARCTGFNILQNFRSEAPIDLSKPLLPQRTVTAASDWYNKPLILTRPLKWRGGFHDLADEWEGKLTPDPDLLLLHTHYIDIDLNVERDKRNSIDKWLPSLVKERICPHNLPKDRSGWETFYDELFREASAYITSIPEDWKPLF